MQFSLDTSSLMLYVISVHYVHNKLHQNIIRFSTSQYLPDLFPTHLLVILVLGQTIDHPIHCCRKQQIRHIIVQNYTPAAVVPCPAIINVSASSLISASVKPSPFSSLEKKFQSCTQRFRQLIILLQIIVYLENLCLVVLLPPNSKYVVHYILYICTKPLSILLFFVLTLYLKSCE